MVRTAGRGVADVRVAADPVAASAAAALGAVGVATGQVRDVAATELTEALRQIGRHLNGTVGAGAERR